MKNKLISFLLFFVAGWLFTNNTALAMGKIKHVIVIGVDAMSVGGIMQANTPHFHEYMKNGAYSLHTRNVLPTISAPNWEAMLTSSGVALTGVTSNDWRIDNYNLPPVVTTENSRYPDIFYVLKKTDHSLKTAAIHQWDGFGNLYDHQFVDIEATCKDERATADKVIEVIKNDKPNFLFIHFDQCDHAGHVYGHMTPNYLKAVELADQLAGEIVNSTKEAGIFDETLFIIVADHGGKGKDHGHETLQGNEVPFILYGNSIKKGYEIPALVRLYDVAATSAFVFHAEMPQAWEGRPVECAFEGFGEPKNLIGTFMAPSTYIPVISPNKPNGEVGGLYVNQKATVTITSAGPDGKIRYTTDGTTPTAHSEVYQHPFEITSSGVVKAAYFGNDGKKSDCSKGYFRVIKQPAANTGVNFTLYKCSNLTKVPDFSILKPSSNGKTLEINTDEIEAQIGENTALVFQGQINIATDGQYTFSTLSDDGSKLYIDGKLIVDNDGDHGVQERQGSTDLTKGKHQIRVEYFNAGGGCFLNCLISGPGIPRQIISPDILENN
ncbi:MAG TPA: alkaline phosphatase family protein [Prolixibacteraceae bacterium]|nr:alkaline phosphatase family protein [Prolixibacteraceae bacterium]